MIPVHDWETIRLRYGRIKEPIKLVSRETGIAQHYSKISAPGGAAGTAAATAGANPRSVRESCRRADQIDTKDHGGTDRKLSARAR